jgi:NAD(P)H-quinone oxidoreductase subunit 5
LFYTKNKKSSMKDLLVNQLIIFSPLYFIFGAIYFKLKKTNNTKSNIQFINVGSVISFMLLPFIGYNLYATSDTHLEVFNYFASGALFRIDTLSFTMFTMIQILAFVLLKYSNTYLEGDKRHTIFISRLFSTLVSVQIMVISGDLIVLFLAWVATSLTVSKLLLFYSDRRKAVIATKKKFILARLGDATFFIAIVLMYKEFNTLNISEIFEIVKSLNTYDISSRLEIIGIFLAITAIVKSAQLPFHGWLIEVMEAPTPVSALLHAGLLNAGPFLMIRFAYIIDKAEYGQFILILFGGLTALLASIMFTTQSAVKTALGYSSIAHMGFSLFTCGIGVFPAALLHLVAHSFYKAHAFLKSGSYVEVVRASKIKAPIRSFNSLKIFVGIGISIAVFWGLAILFGIHANANISFMFIGIILSLGISQIIVSAIDSDSFKSTIFLSIGMSGVVSLCFIIFESLSKYLINGIIPSSSNPTFAATVLILIILTLFTIIIVSQHKLGKLQGKESIQKIGIHFRNGLYLNTYFDKFLGAYKLNK